MFKTLNKPENTQIKKFLEIDYPRSRATGYYANFLLLRATGISNNKNKLETPE